MGALGKEADSKATNAGTGAQVQPLLTYRQAARVLGVCERTVQNYVNRDKTLRAVRPTGRGHGRSVRIALDDLSKFIEDSKGRELVKGGTCHAP